MVLVIGGSGSGKSAYAEEVAVSLYRQTISSKEKPSAGKKYYLATMQVYDEEGQRRVNRHKALRSGKGFLTIEQPTDIGKSIGKMEPGNHIALLECISNLTANEMFETGGAGEHTPEEVLLGIQEIRSASRHLIAVTNDIFSDGIRYDKTTEQYQRYLGWINRKLAEEADEVTEIVCGIPLCWKE